MYVATCDGCEKQLDNVSDDSFAVASDSEDIMSIVEMQEWTVVKGPFGRVILYCTNPKCQKKAKRHEL